MLRLMVTPETVELHGDAQELSDTIGLLMYAADTGSAATAVEVIGETASTTRALLLKCDAPDVGQVGTDERTEG